MISQCPSAQLRCFGVQPPELVNLLGARLHPQAAKALEPMIDAARAQGFEPRIASGYRDFARQLHIFNAKAKGLRPLLDSHGQPLDAARLSESELLHAILRWSALPGLSRHHWGSDLDIYDASVCREGYQLQLTQAECDGVMAPFHRWLSRWLDAQTQWFRPYAVDLQGVAPEPWHLSYRPLAQVCSQDFSIDHLRDLLAQSDIALKPLILADMPALVARYGRISP